MLKLGSVCLLVQRLKMTREDLLRCACSVISNRPVNNCFDSLRKKTEKLHRVAKTPPSDWAAVKVALVLRLLAS